MAAVVTAVQAPVARVALVSGLPPPLHRKVVKALPHYSCEVVQVLDLHAGMRGPRSVPKFLDVDAVLFLYEIASVHLEEQFERVAEAARKPFIRISHRSSLWADQLEPLHQAMAQARAIAPADVETVCRIITLERVKGTPWEDLCRLIQPYYRNTLNGWPPVRLNLKRLQSLNETPRWFGWFPNGDPSMWAKHAAASEPPPTVRHLRRSALASPPVLPPRRPFSSPMLAAPPAPSAPVVAPPAPVPAPAQPQPVVPPSEPTLPALPVPPAPPSAPASTPSAPMPQASEEHALRRLFEEDNERLQAENNRLRAELAKTGTEPTSKLLLLQVVHALTRLTEQLSKQ